MWRGVIGLALSAALLAGCSAQAGEAARAQPSPAPSPRAAEAGADVSLVLEGEEERLVRCNHGNGPAPDHVCESVWLDGTLYQGADCLTAMFGEGALDAAAD